MHDKIRDLQTWLVGDKWKEEEQLNASKETYSFLFLNSHQRICDEIASSTPHQS
jgi:hypothetical protein